MSSTDAWVWVDGANSTCAPPMLRCLSQRRGGVVQVQNHFASARKRRALEPSSAMFRLFRSSSHRFDIDLSELRVVDQVDLFPEQLARLRESAHRSWMTVDSDPTLIIPAILLIESLWMWSARAAALLMEPASLDLTVSRATADGTCRISGEILTPHRGATELRRIAWLGQDAGARRSWASVYTSALQGQVTLEMPKARLRGWAWGVELPRGVLVAEFNGVKLDFDLPHPDAELVIAGTRKAIPPEPALEHGFVSFM